MTEPAALTHAEADRAMDPIRAEILAGRPLVVLTGKSLLAHVREALAVCGRTDDGLTLHTGGRIFWPERLSRTCRRPDPNALPDEDPYRERQWLHDMVGSRARALSAVPPIGRDEATAPGAVVAIIDRGSSKSLGTAYALWLLAEAGERAKAEGRPGPLLILDDEGGRLRGMPKAMRNAFETWERAWEGPNMAIWTHGDPGTPEPSWAAVDAGEWERRLAAFDARARRTAGEGWETGEMDGRLVVARDAYEGDRRGAEVFEIMPDGTCAGVLVRAFEQDVPDLGRLVTLCLRSGFAPFTSKGRGWDCRMVQDPVGAAMADGDAWPKRRAGVSGIVRHRLDLPLGRALRVTNGRESLLRLLAGEGAARARRDFVLTWPFMAQALLDPAVREAVDRGEETIPLVSEALGSTRAVARRLVGHPATPCGAYETGMDPRQLGEHLGEIGHDRLPDRGDARGWTALILLLQKLHQIAQVARMEPVPPAVARDLLLAIPGRDWAGRGTAIFEGRGGGSLQDIGDMVSVLALWLRRLTGVDVEPGMAFAVLAGHGSLARMLDASVRWHDDARLTGDSGSLPHDCAWPVPFDAVDLGDGWTATALADLPSLRAEGREGDDGEGMAGLGHCVGGYGPACQTGRSIVLSLRHAGPGGTRRVSTAELNPGPGDWRLAGRPYHLAQHRGPGNARPERDAENRLSRLSYLLAGGAVPVRREALDLRKPVESDPGDPGQALALLPAWRRVLPEPWSRLDVDGMRTALVRERSEWILRLRFSGAPAVGGDWV